MLEDKEIENDQAVAGGGEQMRSGEGDGAGDAERICEGFFFAFHHLNAVSLHHFLFVLTPVTQFALLSLSFSLLPYWAHELPSLFLFC